MKNKLHRIPLKNSRKYVLVDQEDSTQLIDHGWEVHSNGYIICRETIKIGSTRVRRCVYIHRAIMSPGRSQKVRFKDGNPFNCRKDNLYLVGPVD